MLQRMFPGRVADRLILRVTDLLDTSPTPSAWVHGVMIDWLDAMEESEGSTSAAKDAATYGAYVGYALRMIEEVDGTARPLDREVAARLEQVRAEAPEHRRREFEEAIADPRASDFDRQYLKQIYESGNEHPYTGERAVLDALIAESMSLGWLEGRRFFDLTGCRSDVWRIFVVRGS